MDQVSMKKNARYMQELEILPRIVVSVSFFNKKQGTGDIV